MTFSEQDLVVPDLVEAETADTGRRPRWAVLRNASWKLWTGLAICAFFVVIAAIGPFVAPNPNQTSPIGLEPPSPAHWFGTTNIGQDVLTQVVAGTTGSVAIGFIAGAITVILSMLFGVGGGFLGGKWDEASSLISNVFLVIPGLPLLIIVTDYVQSRSIVVIAIVIAIVSWAGAARVLRAQTLSVRSRDYVDAARVASESTWRIMLREILPNLMPIIASQFVFGALGAILAEAGLSFLGLGAPGGKSWGSILFFAQNAQAITLGAWWWFVPPGLCIAVLGAALGLINFSIDERINPRLRTLAVVKRAKRNATREATR
ncbi:ABC transporter permease [Humibacter sp.]|jgi:peptide/nickel transport system permease protein|uniref:ABC transporter permease n=1 Tax=Humibacter sp. TaxID=1940291 RepID=UPI002B75CB68|nr:ABC transporter permease [Humibacter sp.]HVX06998.1 ABC transporter permease [Humibacter sp.]